MSIDVGRQIGSADRNRRLFPCGLSRREFVWEMGAGFVGLALSALLDQEGFFARHVRAAEGTAGGNPLGPKAPQTLGLVGIGTMGEK